jgi:hypothetical protein
MGYLRVAPPALGVMLGANGTIVCLIFFRALRGVLRRDFRKWLRVHVEAPHQQGNEALFFVAPLQGSPLCGCLPMVPASRSHPNTRKPPALGTPFRSPSPWATFGSRLRRFERSVVRHGLTWGRASGALSDLLFEVSIRQTLLDSFSSRQATT